MNFMLRGVNDIKELLFVITHGLLAVFGVREMKFQFLHHEIGNGAVTGFGGVKTAETNPFLFPFFVGAPMENRLNPADGLPVLEPQKSLASESSQ